MATINLGKVRTTFGGSFNKANSYDILTIVDNPFKVKYISKVAVPIGSSLSDTKYWEPLSGVFAEQYQGDFAVAPTVRIDGGVLQAGDLYFDTTTYEMKVYTGTGWRLMTLGGQFADIGSAMGSGIQYMAQASAVEDIVVKSGTNCFSVDSFELVDGATLTIEAGSTYKII